MSERNPRGVNIHQQDVGCNDVTVLTKFPQRRCDSTVVSFPRTFSKQFQFSIRPRHLYIRVTAGGSVVFTDHRV